MVYEDSESECFIRKNFVRKKNWKI